MKMKSLWAGALIAGLLLTGTAPTATARAETEKTQARLARTSTSLVDQGVVALGEQKLDDARRRFEEAAVANPRNALAFSYLGYTHHRLGKIDVADHFFETALAIDPNEVHALSWGGQVDLSAADLEGAEAKLQRLARLCGPGCAEFRTLSDAVTTYKTARPAN